MCSECLDLPEVPYRYVQGKAGGDESIILGIFTLHNRNDKDQYNCGTFRNHTEGLEVIGMEAFFHAVQEVSKTTGMNFSALAFDDCYSLNRASYIVSSFMSGSLKIPNSLGGFVDPKRVAVIIGPYSSGVTVPLSFQFMSLTIPVISYASSSPDLDDRVNFPYFYRTVPSDVDQARAMIKIVKSMNWQYVGLVYVDNNYGSKGKELLMKYANESAICVADPVLILSSANNDYYSILEKMKQRNADIFLYFGTDTIMRNLLRTMNTHNRNFAFIASEDNYDILYQYGRVSRGSIVFKFETITTDKTFRDFIKTKKPVIEQENMWFREFWSNYFECNPIGGFDKRFSDECSNSLTFSDNNVTNFIGDHTVNHVMNAVCAAGIALKEVQENICVFTPPPCDNSINTSPGDVAAIFQNVRLSMTTQAGKSESFRVFNDDRNGNIGFEILNVQKSGVLYVNEKVKY